MTSAIPTAPSTCQKLSFSIPAPVVTDSPLSPNKDKEVRDDDNDDHALLATLAVKVAYMEAEINRLESKYVQLQRYIHIERAVLGLITLVLGSLAAFAMKRLLGAG